MCSYSPCKKKFLLVQEIFCENLRDALWAAKIIERNDTGGIFMGDIFMVILIMLMVSYAFWDELFTN